MDKYVPIAIDATAVERDLAIIAVCRALLPAWYNLEDTDITVSGNRYTLKETVCSPN